MLLVLCVLVGAVVFGWLANGRLRNLARTSLRGVWLAGAAVGLQLVLGLISLSGGPVELVGRGLLGVSHLALLGFILANRYLPGMLLVALGAGLNALVITVNGAMPVAPGALEAVGAIASVEPGKHQLLSAAHALPWLADVIPLPPLRTVVSVGDVILAAGVGLLVVSRMRHQPAAHEPSIDLPGAPDPEPDADAPDPEPGALEPEPDAAKLGAHHTAHSPQRPTRARSTT